MAQDFEKQVSIVMSFETVVRQVSSRISANMVAEHGCTWRVIASMEQAAAVPVPQIVGIVDSEDHPLDISGETLLQDKIMRVIKKNQVKKYLEILAEIAELKDDYEKFYEQYGKCRNDEDSTVGVKTAELLTFNTSGDEQICLREHIDRMKEGQNDIWHITGESIAVVSSSPFEENLRQKGLEVLYMVDPVDEHAVQQLKEFDGKKLKSTTKEGFDIGDDDEKKTLEELNTEFEPLAELTEGVLGDKGEKVIASDRIVDSPCILTTSEYGWSAKMERIIEAQALRDNSMTSHMVPKKTMEVNPAAWERQHKQQQQQQQCESSKHQPTKKSTRQERWGERKEEERDQEGRKEEEKEAEDGGEQVEKDVTGWTEVTRNKRKKMVQIFVKVDGRKTVAMEVSPEDKVQKILKTVSGSDQDVYVTSGGRILRRDEKLKSCEVTDGCTVEVTSRTRGGGKHKDKKSKIEKERSGSPKKIEQAQGQKAEVEPSRNVDEMYVLMEEQMRLMSEEAKSLHVTDKVMQRIVEHVVKMRLMTENMKKEASDDDLQRVEKMEQGLKVFMEEMRDRQKELEMRETKEEVGRKATREGRGCAGLVQGGDETHRTNETCGKGKGKGNGGKGEHGGKGDKGGKGHEGTRKLRWADCEEEEEGERKEQGIIWLDGSYEDQEDHDGSAGGERCEVCGRLEVWSEESEEQEERGGQGGEGARQKMPSEEDEEDERTVVEPPGLEGVKSKQEEQEEEERRAHEARGEEKRRALEAREEEKRAQEAREEEKRAQEAREEEKRAQEAREEEKRAQEAREEEKRAQEAREEEKRAQETREEEKRAQEAREEERRAQEAREEERRAQEAREEERRAQEAREEQRRAQEAREEQRRAQEAREEQRRAQEAPELRRSEREVSAREERTEQEREVEAQEGHESEGKAQEGHEGEVKAQGGQQENANSVHEECHVSNRHMTWWHNAWWIRVDNGPHMRSARGRRRVWRAARRAAEQARDADGAGEVQRLAEEAEREKWGRKQTDRQTRQGSENTLHIVFHLPEMATATTPAATAAAAATRTLQ